MNIDKAIEVLKEAKYIGSDKYATDYDKRMNEAIDTVLKESESKKYTAEDMEEFAQLVSEKYNIEPEISSPEKLLWYEGGFLQTGETYSISQLRELWEQERRAK